MSIDSRNNFKRLAEEEGLQVRDDKKIRGTISFISSISKVIELYLPGFFQLMISISGGGDDKKSAPSNKSNGSAKKDNKHEPSEPPQQ